jgi:hypothetical protein
MKTKLLLLSLMLSLSTYSWAQGSSAIFHENLKTHLDTVGTTTYYDGSGWLQYKQDSVYRSLVFATNLWIGAYDENGELIVNAPTYDASPIIGGDGPVISRIFKVSAEQILAHQADFADNGVIDDPIPEIMGWPAKGNANFNTIYPDLELPDDSAILASFWDVNGDGVYDATQGDYPAILIRGCSTPTIPTEINWVLYQLHSDEDLVFQVGLSLFYIACEEENAFNNAVFLQYHIANISTKTLSDAYLGIFIDPDLGCYADDYVGTFPERGTAFVYNSSDVDEDCFDDQGFGENPPVLGIDMLRGPIDENGMEVGLSGINHYFNGAWGIFPPATTDPNNALEYYNRLQGFWRDGSQLSTGGIGYGGTDTVAFSFPGLPTEEGAWTEWQEENPEGDRRLLLRSGPFTILPGAVNEIITSYQVYDEGDNHLDKVEGLRDQVDIIQAFFDSCFEIDSDFLPPCNQIFTDTEDIPSIALIKVFPNPARAEVQVEASGAVTKLWLIDATGKRIRQVNESRMGLEGIASGLYFLGIELDGQQHYRKLMIQK